MSASGPADGSDERHRAAGTVAILVATQAAAGTGFYAVVAHLVVHLRHDLGLLASTASIVLAVRTIVQYALYLPAGALTDRLGPARAGALACVVRGGGFALLGIAVDPASLTAAAILIGAGGSVYTPAGQTLLAALPGGWPQRGFAWYTAAAQVSAVAGPVLGLAVLSATSATSPGLGFRVIAWAAAVLWGVAGTLFALVGRAPLGHPTLASAAPANAGRRRRSTLTAAFRDTRLLRFAAVTCPATLLITQAAVVVPLMVADSGLVTAYLAVGAGVTALVQLPKYRVRLIRHGVVCGFAGLAAGYLLLAPVALTEASAVRTAVVVISGAVYGAAQGLLLPALFYYGNALAPAGSIASYIGIRSFVSGVVAFIGALAAGFAFDHGTPGAAGAASALGVLALGAAVAAGRVPSSK